MTTLTTSPPSTTSGQPLPGPDERPAVRPRWERPVLIGLLVATAVLYLWGLSGSGWANSFYAAAAQAGSESWKAFFFGSSDAANSITVDKTPLSLWPMSLSIRAFGLSSWSLLVPQALEGVAAVGLLYATVRRSTGSAVAGLIAGAVLATTPVAVLMFRFDNPDALLTLLLIGSAAATLRAVEADPAQLGRPLRWLALAGALVGLGFLTKMLQAFLVIPALGLVYLLFAHTSIPRRIAHLLVALGVMIASAGWWVAIVSLWPASSRPYIGGSQNNSILELTLGYNGFGRLTGNEIGSVGGSMWGSTGLGRLLGSDIGGQVTWLLPTSLLLLVAGLWLTRRVVRTDPVRAALVVWGAWLLVTAATFSFMAGIFHAYYTVALAPAIGAIVGIGAWLLWNRRDSLIAAALRGAAVSMTAVLAFILLGRTPDFLPWLRWMILIAAILVALAVTALATLPRRASIALAAAAFIVGLAGPSAYAVQTAGSDHTSAIPSAGPAVPGGGFGGGRFGGGAGGFGGAPGGFAGGQLPAQGQAAGQTQVAPPRNFGQRGGPAFGGGAGGLLDASESTAEITALLKSDASDYTWVAAALGSNSAAGYQLASQEPVMAIGGFNGSDPAPTLAQFQEHVASGQIHYFIAGGGGGFGGRMGQMGGSEASGAIATWVSENFSAATVDGVTLYDLSGTR